MNYNRYIPPSTIKHHISETPIVYEDNSHIYTLEEALESDLPIYTKALVNDYPDGVVHISKALESGDAKQEGNYYRFTNTAFIYNVLHGYILKVFPNFTIQV